MFDITTKFLSYIMKNTTRCGTYGFCIITTEPSQRMHLEMTRQTIICGINSKRPVFALTYMFYPGFGKKSHKRGIFGKFFRHNAFVWSQTAYIVAKSIQ